MGKVLLDALKDDIAVGCEAQHGAWDSEVREAFSSTAGTAAATPSEGTCRATVESAATASIIPLVSGAALSKGAWVGAGDAGAGVAGSLAGFTTAAAHRGRTAVLAAADSAIGTAGATTAAGSNQDSILEIGAVLADVAGSPAAASVSTRLIKAT
jgi:hypothetical protein